MDVDNTVRSDYVRERLEVGSEAMETRVRHAQQNSAQERQRRRPTAKTVAQSSLESDLLEHSQVGNKDFRKIRIGQQGRRPTPPRDPSL